MFPVFKLDQITIDTKLINNDHLYPTTNKLLRPHPHTEGSCSKLVNPGKKLAYYLVCVSMSVNLKTVAKESSVPIQLKVFQAYNLNRVLRAVSGGEDSGNHVDKQASWKFALNQ